MGAGTPHRVPLLSQTLHLPELLDHFTIIQPKEEAGAPLLWPASQGCRVPAVTGLCSGVSCRLSRHLRLCQPCYLVPGRKQSVERQLMSREGGRGWT